ncbi:trithorax group protein osa-like [Panonychus citri]|uniref:trithorax group protein osa-like n=1 Tax=Panonychus citri TaxID=50023 RepID=UPI00230759F1|nr:trithorax group protein osa-like [Panonychus citri]
MLKTFSILSATLLLTLTVFGSAEEDRNLLSKLNSNIELNKVTNKPIAPVSGEPLKTAETRPGPTGNDFITSSHTEQSYSSSASFESSGGHGGSPGSSAELGGGRGPGPVNSQSASSGSYQVSGENFSGSSGEVQSQQNQPQQQPQQQQQQQQQQPQQHQPQQPSGQQQGSPEVYSSSGEDTSSGPSSQSPSGPVAFGRPDLNEVDFGRNLYPNSGPRNVAHHPYGSSFEIAGQTFDLQRNPEPSYDNGATSGEYSSSQNNVNNEGGYGLNQDTSAYEDTNSNEDEGSAYRTQDPEGSPAPLAAHGSGPEHHQQVQVQQQAPSSAEQGGRKTSTLSSGGPVPDYGGFRPVIKSQAIPIPQIPGPQRPSYGLGNGEPYRSVSINYESPKSIYNYDGLSNTANTGSYNTKSFPVYGGNGQGAPREHQPQGHVVPTSHAGYGLDYASGKPYGGDLSVKPYSADPNGNVKNIPMTIGYDEFVKPPTPSAAQYHSAGAPHRPSHHHGSEYIVSHGPPQQNYEQGPPPPQGHYGRQPQGPPPPQGQQGQQQGPPQLAGGYGQPVTYQATPIGYAQPDAYDQQSGPVNYEHQQPHHQGPPPPQQQHQHQQHQQQQPQQQGPTVSYGQQSPPVGYEQSVVVQGPHPPQPQQGPPQGHPQGAHPPPQAHGQHQPPPPPQQQVQQTPPGYGPPNGPGPISGPPSAGPPQYEQEPNYGPPPPPQQTAPVNYEQTGPNEYQQTPNKPGYEQTTTFVESSGYPGNLGPSYGTIKDGPSPLTASVPASAPIEGYSGNMGSENEYYQPSSYDSLENSAGPSNYPPPPPPSSMNGYNSQGASYSSGGYSIPEDSSYMSSLFGFPTYDVTSGKGNPYASGSNPIPSPASPGSHLSGISSVLTGSPSGKPSAASFLPSIKLTGSGIKFTGFGSSLTGGLGSINQAIASTLGSGLSSVTGPGLGLGSGLGSNFASSLSASLGSTGGVANGVSPLHPGGPSGHTGSSGGLGGPLAAFYNNLSGLGAPFGNIGGNYGTAASKLIPQVIRAPFRTMYRALMGSNANHNPLNG